MCSEMSLSKKDRSQWNLDQRLSFLEGKMTVVQALIIAQTAILFGILIKMVI